MRVVFFSAKRYDKTSFGGRTCDHELVFLEARLEQTTACLAEHADIVCVFVNDVVNVAVLRKLHEYGIKAIALRCAGYNNVDLEEAEKLGIQVVRVPRYSPHAVAEHAVSLLLTAVRRMHRAVARVREGNFELSGLLGFDIFGRTVGVVGTGAIGACFAKIMLGFGCRVLAYDVYPNEELKGVGVEYVEGFEDLCRECDIISLHCPLLPSTSHLVRKETLELMKDGVTVINTSRGALIDTCDMIEAVKRGKVGLLCLDVLEEEAGVFFDDHSEDILHDDVSRLITMPQVVTTGHQAWFTSNALDQIAAVTLKNIDDVANGIVNYELSTLLDVIIRYFLCVTHVGVPCKNRVFQQYN
ncbi:MAG: hypothetical protein MHM6MM_000754 [Cercozoa sp. M6MM]